MRFPALIALIFAMPFVYADTSAVSVTSGLVDEAATIDADAGAMESSQVVERISSSFSDFLGEQSTTVVKGLRSGEEFTLTSSYTGSMGIQQTETITIEPPTSKMGYGNVNITLKLTEYELSQVGITQPTALELEAALLGGSITTPDGQVVDMQGVLTLRSEGMGWGQIAQQYDTKLGYIVGKAGTKTSTVAETSSSGPGNKKTEHARSLKTAGVSAGKGHAYGHGIVSASGAPVGTINVHGNGNAFGAGKVDGSFASAPSGNSSAGSVGKAFGHTK